MGHNTTNRDGQKISLQERRAKALDYRKSRLTFQQIADRLKISKGQAYKDVAAAIAAITAEPAAEVLAQEIELIDAMARGLMKRALIGDDKAVTSMLRLMERRARYLGLDAPTKVEASGTAFTIMVDPSMLPEGTNLGEINVSSGS